MSASHQVYGFRTSSWFFVIEDLPLLAIWLISLMLVSTVMMVGAAFGLRLAGVRMLEKV
jgi:hypothetical protein